ncbi:MAG: high-affinity branched-chain amino acid transport protein superfamily, ATP-binding [Modestobacter sp.]|nr:high-affinity branched-chain amino acid transport protein superfamily, ATP-binding [Modestobacter sp.]
MADRTTDGSTAVRGPAAAGRSGTGSGDAGTPALEVRGLTTSYGPVRALDGVSLTAGTGRITAVLGANGAGKTALLRTISGLVRCSDGQVLLHGEDITRGPVEGMVTRGMAHVPEGRGVIAELTVEENLRVGSLFRGRTPRSEFDRVYELFPRLTERRDQPAHVLSGGERQMLVIGRALLARPKLLLLDEPSLGLAPRIVAQIFGLLRQLVDAEGLSVLLVEQNARSALSVADVGVVLNLGRVVATDDARTLMADEDLRHAYLGF